MGVEPKIGGKHPKSSHFNRVFPYKPSILGYHYFWKHPYNFTINTQEPCWLKKKILSTSLRFQGAECDKFYKVSPHKGFATCVSVVNKKQRKDMIRKKKRNTATSGFRLKNYFLWLFLSWWFFLLLSSPPPFLLLSKSPTRTSSVLLLLLTALST